MKRIPSEKLADIRNLLISATQQIGVPTTAYEEGFVAAMRKVEKELNRD